MIHTVKAFGIVDKAEVDVFLELSWEIDGEKVETVSDFIFWGSKITADGDYSYKIKRHLLLGRKVCLVLTVY